MAYRLSELLEHADVSAAIIRRAFEDMLEAQPKLANYFRTDLAATLERDPATNRAVEPLLYFKGFHAIQTYRFFFTNCGTRGGKTLPNICRAVYRKFFRLIFTRPQRLVLGSWLTTLQGW